MKLYYGLTNYHLLCSIVHKIIYNKNEKTIFMASQGILKSRIDKLRKLNFFNEVYYLEDTEIRDSCFNILNINSTKKEIEIAAIKFVGEFEKIMPFNFNKINDIYLVADHGVFGIYTLIKKYPYNYLEDGRGIYSNWKILDRLLAIKNPGIQIMSNYYGAYGKSKLIKQKYISLDSQLENYNLDDCIDFDINKLLDEINEVDLDKILGLFNVIRYTEKHIDKTALILTQRFSAYKMLNEEECIQLYLLLTDIFAKDCKIYLKPHPADNCNYNKVFKNAIILEKEMPSELIRFSIRDKFDVGICTYSSSINSLKAYINKIYNMDERIVEFKGNRKKIEELFLGS